MRSNQGLLLFILLIPTCMQALQAQGIWWLRAGGHYSRITGIQSNHYTPQMGFHLGAGFERIFSKSAGWKAEALINSKGFTSFYESSTLHSYQSSSNQVEQLSLLIPLQGTWHGKLFALELGPYFDFLIKSSQYQINKVRYGTGELTQTELTDHSFNAYRNPEMGMALGAGLELFSGIYIKARYMQAFTPLGNDYHWRRMSRLQFSLSKRFGRVVAREPMYQVASAHDLRKDLYRIGSRQQIGQVVVNRLDSGRQVIFRWRAAETGALQISQISLEASSGLITGSGSQLRITEASFPLSIRLRFTVTNPTSQQSYESNLELEILEPGLWNVGIWN